MTAYGHLTGFAQAATSGGKRLLTFALGTLTLLCRIVLLANPVIVFGILTILLTLYFILGGSFEIAAGFTTAGDGWLIFGGAVSMLPGIMMRAQYPLSGALAMATLLGIKLFFVG